jgi:RNA polymerase sigma factor (sigma-70 family)
VVVNRQKPLAGESYPDDRSLVRACAAGDAEAWSRIVDRYERLVYAIPLREGLTHHEAADVAQETFAALMTSLGSIRQPERLGSWLMTVARRLTWRERSKAARRTLDLETIDIEAEGDLGAESVNALWVYQAVQSLGEPCRSLVISLFFDPSEPDYAEIAVRLGRPIGSVGPLRARCLDRLRRLLEDA